MIGKKLRVVLLVALRAQVECAAGVGKQCRRQWTKNWNAIFDVGQDLRVGARSGKGAWQLHDVAARGSGEQTDVRERLRQPRHRSWSSRSIARQDDVPRTDVVIQRRDRCNRSDVVAANRKLISQKE